jgi:predicted O-methyltransferase YrrM
MNLTNNDKLFVAAIFVIALAVSIASSLVNQQIWLAVSLASIAALLAAIQLETYRRTQETFKEQKQMYWHGCKQIESMFSIVEFIKPKFPLPEMREWAVSPDLAKILLDIILEKKPQVILETGSGTSTLIIAYALQKNGSGKIFSLENNEKYAEKTRENISKHGLEDFVEVVYAPLKELPIKGKTWQWYDTSILPEIKTIDLLIVDGPKRTLQPMSRYPAMPLVFDKLTDRAIVVLDDFNTDEEKAMVNLWVKEFKGFDREKIKTEKETMILRKK